MGQKWPKYHQIWPKYCPKHWDKSNIWPKMEEKDEDGHNNGSNFEMANKNEEKEHNLPKNWPNFEVTPGVGKYEELKMYAYKFCKSTGLLDSKTKSGPLAEHRSVLGHVWYDHIPDDVQI